MQVYLDESGDTGWSFSKPYRAGGSSRFLCLAIMFLPKADRKRPKRIIADMYKKYRWCSEKKSSSASSTQKLEFALKAAGMLGTHRNIRIDCIVAKKENVQAHIRSDANKLYNYMCGLVIPEYVKSELEFDFLPDKRSVKVKSGNSLSDYLQTVLWFHHSLTTKLINNPQESDKNYNLQFVDWIAHCVWAHFEDGETTVFDKLSPAIKVRQLFFRN
jgi:Protein of unknown function (DUF3800)